MRTACSSSHLLGVSASVHAGIHPLGLDTSPWAWAWTTPGHGPGSPTLGVGLDTLSPARPPNLPLGPGPRHWTDCGQTDRCKNITFANFVCGR